MFRSCTFMLEYSAKRKSVGCSRIYQRKKCINDDKYPEMTNGWTKAFWARGYYVATVGNITEEAVKEYIQRQKEESKREDTRK